MKTYLFKTALAATLMMLTSTAASAQDRPRIVTVNHALQFLTERLVGDTAEVVFPVPKNVDPSFWRPAIADISMIQSADLILLNGAGFATWVDRVSLPRSKVVNTSAAIEDQFIVTESITHSHGDGGEHSHEGLASYLWLDPTLAAAQAQAVANALTAKKVVPADQVEKALTALSEDLEALDAKAKAALADLGGVTIIATHPRYQYLADRYGLSVTSLEWEASTMPDDAQMADLKTLVSQTGARVLMWEAVPPPGAIELAADLGLQSVVFAPLAHGVDGVDFIQSYMASLTALSELDLQ